MQRTAFATLSCLLAAIVASAQEPASEPPEVQAVIGAPFSDAATEETIRTMADGTQFVTKKTSRHFRDGQGRVRWERDIPLSGVSTDQPNIFITINNKVTGELDSLFPSQKLAGVVQRPGIKVVDTPVTLPEIATTFAGVRLGPKDPGWSAPVTLGEKTIDGIHAVGSQRVYVVPAGKANNSKAVTVTVQQWSSPELGIIVDKLVTSTTGGKFHYYLTQLTQAEPDPALFKVPADYKIVGPQGTGKVVETPPTANR
jgi:hypothetical protein